MIVREIIRQSRHCLSLTKKLSTESLHPKTTSVVNLYAGDWPESFVALNNLHDNPGATKSRIRVGRGTGSGRGKTCGRGHKGQKARSGRKPRLLFAGGQTPLSRAVAKKGFHNPCHVEWNVLNLEHLSDYIERGRLKTEEIITMKTLRDSGIVGKKIKHGVKVLGRGASKFKHKVHLQVSKCSIKAEEAIERNGGTVRMVYYNQISLRALLKPQAYIKKGLLIPTPPRYIPTKRAAAYDFIGDTVPETNIEENEQHFDIPKRKQPGHPGLPPGKGHIKNRYTSRIIVDYGKKARVAEAKKRKENTAHSSQSIDQNNNTVV